jgi:hypothetical protein
MILIVVAVNCSEVGNNCRILEAGGQRPPNALKIDGGSTTH